MSVSQQLDKTRPPASEQDKIAFAFAPRLTHDRIERLTPTQQAEALHEFVEYRDAVKRHVFNPGKNPHTRILALGTLIDQAEKACAKHKDLSEPLPFWAGRPEQEGSFSARVGLGQNFISSELQAYEKAGLVTRPHRRSDNGNDHTDLAVLPALLSSPELLPDKGQRPRKPTIHCRSCGSDVLVKEVRTTVVCACCGAIHSEHKSESMVNEPEEDTPIVTSQVIIEEADIVTSQVIIEEADTPPQTPALDPREIFEAAAALLVEIAGDENQHAEMNQAGKKYGPVYHPFDLEDARAHLSGKSTRAARLLRQDGKTRALCFDGDTYAEMDSLRIAAHLLMAAGYACLLEDSPCRDKHEGGGHLWILFDALVEARAALRHVRELAPMLASVKEYWPGEKKNIRLPGGVYMTPEYNEQCKLYDTIGALVADNRRDAARALLTYQTPASIVPDYPPDPEPESERKQPTVKPAARLAVVTGDVQFTTGQLVAWFNDRHRLEDILAPAEDGALPRAFPTWRDHGNKPNVVYYPTNTWCDFGDGKRGGDALELYCLVSGRDKRDVLSDLGREYRAELIGKNGQIVSCPDSSQPMSAETNESDRGGVSAFDGPYAPPDRESLCCKSRDWQWNEAEQCYECGACHPREVRRDHAA